MKKKESLGNVTHLGGYRREDLATPTFMRREKTNNHANIAAMGINSETDNMDIQIPTFLRRQAD
jgi:cell division protein FtsZ